MRFLTTAILVIMLAGCTTRPSLPYPDLYKEASLPEYKKAWVTNDGKLKDLDYGIRLRLRTHSSLEKTRDYYKKELLALGWKIRDEDEEPPEGFYAQVFTKDDFLYELTIEEQKENTSIAIVYVQKKEPIE